METKKWMSVSEAAKYVGLSKNTIMMHISNGKLVAYRAGPKLIRLHVDDIDAWLKSQTV